MQKGEAKKRIYGIICSALQKRNYISCLLGLLQYEKYNNVSQAVARALEIGNHVDQVEFV